MEMSDQFCSHCLSSEQEIDVKGRKYSENGDVLEYRICHTCCTTLRHYHFNSENEKSREFWHHVWENLELAACVA